MSANDQLNIATIRGLAIDIVEQARSGHPGLPLGAAPMAYTIWSRHLRFHPGVPGWPNRDRFVLSAGHGSALLYTLLHLTGHPGMTLDQLRNFRQYGSLTPGHPEYGQTAGVEVTTGPLGQGIANAVGIALAERHLAARLNRDGSEIVDWYTYVIASDGDLMEGVSSEASSLAGHLKLSRLIVLYDDNGISIDGPTSLAFTEDVAARYRAYGWRVDFVEDGNDVEAIDDAIRRAKGAMEGPTLIRVRTVIGYGSPNRAGTAEAHGSPLGEEEARRTRAQLGLDPDLTFQIPDEVRGYFEQFCERGETLVREHGSQVERHLQTHPELRGIVEMWRGGDMPLGWEESIPRFEPGSSLATRAASGKVLDAIVDRIPLMIGGSADLTPSNNTRVSGTSVIAAGSYGGRYLHYGVREHAMGAIMNGLAVSGIVPYGGTFLVFSDYMRPAIRLAALSGYGSIFVLTHDSIALGEDGPTHQPVEHLAALRAMPDLLVIRPADANETAVAWEIAIRNRNRPTAIALTRQNVPVLEGTGSGAEKGAYAVRSVAEPDIVLAATGSEVHLIVETARVLDNHGIRATVISMPCWKLFEAQPEGYRRQLFPYTVPTLGVEAGIEMGWGSYVDGFIGMKRFGASAPGAIAMEKFMLTPDHVAERAMEMVAEVASMREVVARRAEEEG